jgi:hypothetical protein
MDSSKFYIYETEGNNYDLHHKFSLGERSYVKIYKEYVMV